MKRPLVSLSRRARGVLGCAAFCLSVALGAYVVVAEPRFADGQQLGEGMVRTGTVGIQNEAERNLFSSLICTCGCPRETLATCTCGFAHERRGELRAELGKGLSLEAIRDAYAGRFGTQALAVPKTSAPFVVPAALAAVGLALVSFTLLRWRRRSAANDASDARDAKAASKGKPKSGKAKREAPAPRDAYDDKLDAELRALDDED